MIDLDLAKRLAEGRTRTEWPSEPGWGHDEDEGNEVIGAVGPNYLYLHEDVWEYDDLAIPTGVIPEAQAREKAQADQDFARYFAAHADSLLLELERARAVCEAAEIAERDLHDDCGCCQRCSEIYRSLRKTLTAWREAQGGL